MPPPIQAFIDEMNNVTAKAPELTNALTEMLSVAKMIDDQQFMVLNHPALIIALADGYEAMYAAADKTRELAMFLWEREKKLRASREDN